MGFEPRDACIARPTVFKTAPGLRLPDAPKCGLGRLGGGGGGGGGGGAPRGTFRPNEAPARRTRLTPTGGPHHRSGPTRTTSTRAPASACKLAGAVLLVESERGSATALRDHRGGRSRFDAPLHVHANEDELFYVIEGEHVFTVGGGSSGWPRRGRVRARAGRAHRAHAAGSPPDDGLASRLRGLLSRAQCSRDKLEERDRRRTERRSKYGITWLKLKSFPGTFTNAGPSQRLDGLAAVGGV